MMSHARVAMIGGGVMGVSLLYQLAKRGGSDVILLEKTELTAGSTWHAAGLCTHFAHDPTIMALRAASVRLYRDILPKETGLPTGFHACGALRVTRSPERMDEFRQVQGLGRFLGHDFNSKSARRNVHGAGRRSMTANGTQAPCSAASMAGNGPTGSRAELAVKPVSHFVVQAGSTRLPVNAGMSILLRDIRSSLPEGQWESWPPRRAATERARRGRSLGSSRRHQQPVISTMSWPCSCSTFLSVPTPPFPRTGPDGHGSLPSAVL